MSKRLVCVGHAALRAPDGAMLAAVPIYEPAETSAADRQTGLSEQEAKICDAFAAAFAPMLK